MILKKRIYSADKKVHPLIGVLLFLISIALLVLTAPFGFTYGLLYNLFTKGLVGLGEYCLKIAISIDQLGNVAMQHLLNLLWLKRDNYPFGNRDETISSAIGRNKKLGTLTRLGRAMDKVLDIIDPDHSLNSIDYYIEPTVQVVDKVGWIWLMEGKILTTRGQGKTIYEIPNGERKVGETDTLALQRGVWEKLQITLVEGSEEFIGIFEARADGKPPGNMVRMTCYYAAHIGEAVPGPNVGEIVWLTYKDRELVGQTAQLIFDFLHKKGRLVH